MKKREKRLIYTFLIIILVLNVLAVIFPYVKQYSTGIHIITFGLSVVSILAIGRADKKAIRFYYFSFNRQIKDLIYQFEIEEDEERKEQLRIAFTARRKEATYLELYGMLRENPERISAEIRERMLNDYLEDIPPIILDSKVGRGVGMMSRSAPEILAHFRKYGPTLRVCDEFKERYLANQKELREIIRISYKASLGEDESRLRLSILNIANDLKDQISEESLIKLKGAVGK